jgi:hypothetical protein
MSGRGPQRRLYTIRRRYWTKPLIACAEPLLTYDFPLAGLVKVMRQFEKITFLEHEALLLSCCDPGMISVPTSWRTIGKPQMSSVCVG